MLWVSTGASGGPTNDLYRILLGSPYILPPSRGKYLGVMYMKPFNPASEPKPKTVLA